MTRKDYVMIAAAFAKVRSEQGMDAHTLETLSRELAMKLAQDNSRFDRARFVAACVRE
jgi:hypothetical protein